MATVYVLSSTKKPLMPTTRCGHVRYLLNQGLARVVDTKPFTIQLLYDTEEITQPLYLGIDPGRTNIGMAVIKENGQAVMLVQAETRNKDISKLMAKRKQFRQAHRKHRREKKQRRAVASGLDKTTEIQRSLPGCGKPITCKIIRNKEARFNNRVRKPDWLTPTANHLLLTHWNLIQKLLKYLPITDVVLELNHFAFMAMDNPNIKPWQFAKGPLYQKGSVEQAVYEQQEGKCLLCDGKIEHYHHAVPRSKGGSEGLTNRVGLCYHCHTLVHTDPSIKSKLEKLKAGMNKKYHALSVLNQIIPFLADKLAIQFADHFYVVEGYDTKQYRIAHGIAKDHYLDAYCIACIPLNAFDFCSKHLEPLQIKQFRRHDRQACQQENIKRVYLLDGKPVATNRHRAFEQKEPSLAEYAGAKDRLTVKPHLPIYKRQNRLMPGAVLQTNGRQQVMVASRGLHNGKPDYYYFADGNKATPKQCKTVLNNSGLVII